MRQFVLHLKQGFHLHPVLDYLLRHTEEHLLCLLGERAARISSLAPHWVQSEDSRDKQRSLVRVHFRVHVPVVEDLDALDLLCAIGVVPVVQIDRDRIDAGGDATRTPRGAASAIAADQLRPALHLGALVDI